MNLREEEFYSKLKPAIRRKLDKVIKEKKEEKFYDWSEYIILAITCAIMFKTIFFREEGNGKMYLVIVFSMIAYLITNKAFSSRRKDIKKHRDEFEKILSSELCFCNSKSKCGCNDDVQEFINEKKIY